MAYDAPQLITPPGASPEGEQLTQLVQRELERIAEELKLTEFLQLKTLTSAPSKPRAGMIVLADGTSWNPGSGAGFYGYYGGAWAKLG